MGNQQTEWIEARLSSIRSTLEARKAERDRTGERYLVAIRTAKDRPEAKRLTEYTESLGRVLLAQEDVIKVLEDQIAWLEKL